MGLFPSRFVHRGVQGQNGVIVSHGTPVHVCPHAQVEMEKVKFKMWMTVIGG